ncbi:MAG: cell envelope integrity protein CreD [Pseudomonadota bacterium]
MPNLSSQLRQSATVKALAIGILIVVLLIPLAMIEGVIKARDRTNAEARDDIQQAWGKRQTIAGPVLVLPYETVKEDSKGEPQIRRHELYVLPSQLNIEADVDSEIRYRGIHNVPVYTADVRFAGQFNRMDPAALGIDHGTIRWQDVALVVGIADGRAIGETPAATLNGKTFTFAPGGQVIDDLPPQIRVALDTLTETDRGRPLEFEIQMAIRGSERLSFIPLGDTTNATLTSSWPSPSFNGNYLPSERQVSDDGFEATWQVSSIGRSFPSQWRRGTNTAKSMSSEAFGVEFFMPIGIYRLTLRAATYGVLFIVLTFISYFLIETVAGLSLHPLQYLMVGSANLIFFLLLLSLAEHIGFAPAYLVSALASSGLIVGYSTTVLGQRRRASMIAGVLLVLYGFLYMTLKAATYALLAGSLGLWAALAIIMYLTRRIDWYAKTDLVQNTRVSGA